ncbi:MAG: Crp/Fnr family transcriptional regulator [Alphaproteobacteria bacterium]
MQNINDLETIKLFTPCGDDFFKKLSQNATSQRYAKGKVLFIHGEEAQRFFYIKSGWIKLFRETLDGAQAVVDILPHGNIFGETSIFEDGIYPYSAEIVEPSEIISLPISHLKDEIEKNNKLALNMLRTMARYRRQQDQEIEHRSIQNASQRIGCFLLRLADQEKIGEVTIHLPYDKTLLASRLGMQPETFSRALSKLRQKTGIRVQGATIEMDSLDQLVQYSCAACSSEFPCKDLQTAE